MIAVFRMQCEILLMFLLEGIESDIFLLCWCVVKVGRLPMEWAKSVIPLVQSGNVKVRGRCIATPYKLEMMQEIMLLVRYK